MSLADTAQAMGKAIRTLGVAAALAFAPQVMAAPAAAPVAAATAPAADAVQPAAKADAGAEKSSYVPAKPTPGKGQPVAGALSFQDQYSITGQQALRMYDYVLMPIITVITLFVLVLLLFVMARFRRGANPVASKTSHNTLIEVIWTLLPVLILVVIAVPSIRLLAAQYTPAPKNALTVKATGYQWYWGYTYPDNGGFEVISNMLPTRKR